MSGALNRFYRNQFNITNITAVTAAMIENGLTSRVEFTGNLTWLTEDLEQLCNEVGMKDMFCLLYTSEA